MDIPRFLRAMAKLVEDHTEEFAACFNGASAGVGVKDDPAPKAEQLPIAGDKVSVTVHLPHHSTPYTFSGTVTNVAGEHWWVEGNNAPSGAGPYIFYRMNGKWRTSDYPTAIHIDLERAS